MASPIVDRQHRFTRRAHRAALAVLTVIVACSSLSGRDARAQESETESLRKRVQSLELRQRQLEAEVQELKRLLGARQATPPPATAPGAPVPAQAMSIAGAPFKGNRNAPLTVIEFSDYECGFCGRHARETIPLIDKEFVQTGKVKYVFRSFPNEAIHKLALKAHETAACAGDQGQYWAMHDRLFAKPGALAPVSLMAHGQALGIGAPLEQCLAAAKHRDAIRQELAAGRAAGVTATPTFFLGVAGPSADQVKILRTIRGAKPFAVFKETIEQLLTP
jgi:protein-disulfide isomerase